MMWGSGAVAAISSCSFSQLVTLMPARRDGLTNTPTNMQSSFPGMVHSFPFCARRWPAGLFHRLPVGAPQGWGVGRHAGAGTDRAARRPRTLSSRLAATPHRDNLVASARSWRVAERSPFHHQAASKKSPRGMVRNSRLTRCGGEGSRSPAPPARAASGHAAAAPPRREMNSRRFTRSPRRRGRAASQAHRGRAPWRS
jgi:hypothetical protein